MPFDPWNTDDGFPDDWFQPPSSSAPGTAQPTFGASPNPFNPLLTSAPPSSFSPFGAQPTFNPRQSPFNPVFTNLLPPSHPLSPYFGLSPVEWLRAQAWMPPTFPDAFGQFPRPSPLPPPPPIATSALFGDLTRRLLERTAPAPIGPFGNTAWHPAEVGDAPSISGGGQFDSLANRQPAGLSSQANAPFAPPSDAFASQSFIPPASLALRRLRPRSKRRLPSADCQRSPDIPDCTGVREYELRKGSTQFTLRVPYQGKGITIRLDFPPDEEGIVDLKFYNWWKPGYIRPFLQQVVAKKFQEQIQKYQAAHPNVKLKFSQQPPRWIVRAIEQVGGTYIVDP